MLLSKRTFYFGYIDDGKKEDKGEHHFIIKTHQPVVCYAAVTCVDRRATFLHGKRCVNTFFLLTVLHNK